MFNKKEIIHIDRFRRSIKQHSTSSKVRKDPHTLRYYRVLVFKGDTKSLLLETAIPICGNFIYRKGMSK